MDRFGPISKLYFIETSSSLKKRKQKGWKEGRHSPWDLFLPMFLTTTPHVIHGIFSVIAIQFLFTDIENSVNLRTFSFNMIMR